MKMLLVFNWHGDDEITLASCIAAALKLSPETLDLLLIAEKAVELECDLSQVSHQCWLTYSTTPPSPEGMVEYLRQQGEQYQLLCAPGDIFCKDVLCRYAGVLGTTPVTNVVDIVSKNTVIRSCYAGNVMETMSFSERVGVLLLQPQSFHVTDLRHRSAQSVSHQEYLEPPAFSQIIETRQRNANRPELGQAKFVFSVGRGAQNSLKQIEFLADTAGAAVGVSRVLVDSGIAPNDLQVGQTGKLVAPDIYLAFGISGAIQHLAGIKDSKLIIAVNTDPDAPIMEAADYYLLADSQQVVSYLLGKKHSADS